MDISGNFILIEFSGISRLVKSSKFLKYKVDVSKNLKLIDFSGFYKFQFRVRTVYCKTFLLIIRGSK